MSDLEDLGGHEKNWSGEALLQKSVPWKRGGGALCAGKAGAGGCRDAEGRSSYEKSDAARRGAVNCHC